MKNEIFSENKLLRMNDSEYTKLHLKVSFAKVYYFEIIKVIFTSPKSQLGYIYYKRCISLETTLTLVCNF